MPEASPDRIVADADVLAADLLVGGDARTALDYVRDHDWLTLLASDQLLEDTEAIVADLSTPSLAAAHRSRLTALTDRVDHPPEDHPGLATAYHGGGAHLLSYDDRLTSARTGLSIQPHANLSVKSPAAFVALFDPDSLYAALYDGDDPEPSSQ